MDWADSGKIRETCRSSINQHSAYPGHRQGEELATPHGTGAYHCPAGHDENLAVTARQKSGSELLRPIGRFSRPTEPLAQRGQHLRRSCGDL